MELKLTLEQEQGGEEELQLWKLKEPKQRWGNELRDDAEENSVRDVTESVSGKIDVDVDEDGDGNVLKSGIH